ncbi:MAG TPA: hypothetical protein VJY62_13630, partial [Bacteroidia bacterium]|nr:hypothetical protein [Bacteroidia bacterium]
MKKTLFILSIFLFVLHSNAQITFQKTYGDTGNSDVGHSVVQTADGGYIIVGYTYILGNGASDVYLIKTDAYGDTLWTKIFGGSALDRGNSVQQTSDGGYIITGNTQSTVAGDADIFLIKTDSIGNLVWQKFFGGVDTESVSSVQQVTTGGYIISGITYSFGAGTSDMYLIRTDNNGDTLWTKTYGGVSNDHAISVRQTSDGGFIMTGLTINFAVVENVILIKTGVNGNVIWKKYIGKNADFDWGQAVDQTSDGGYIVFGITSANGAGDFDFLLIKTDANGDTLWTKTFGGIDEDMGVSGQQTTDGGYIFLGTTLSFGAGENDLLLIKTNPSGDTLWTRTYGGIDEDWAARIRQTSDGGYIITGYTKSFGPGDSDVYLIKTDSLGNTNCNQGYPAPLVTSPSPPVVTHMVTVTTPPTAITTANFSVNSGSVVTTLCSTVGISTVNN